ncbi:hypothetical protein like AT4G32930 [Hibiscus trionum]|uniref:CXXC motif containing zinc binding protein n=1 Tax=Hibiscus trionum TaxID=183268 RepID=A0A9W7IAQ6_HIBTR|nr:hypothetical protein like AT4G32930 [Hibiscus trionum]
MVKFMLKIAADLKNLTNLQPQGGCDDPSFSYLFKLKCENCGEMSWRETCVSLDHAVPLRRGKGTTNLIQKCKHCSRVETVTMISGQGKPLIQEESEAGKYAPLMVFECWGYEPVDYVFGGWWKVESVEGTKFEYVDLSGGDFAEYDKEGGCQVIISNLRSTFDVLK